MRIVIVTRQKPDRAGSLPLYVRLAHGGAKKFVSLSMRVPAREWNPNKQEVRASSPQALQLNRILAERLAAAQAAVNELAASGRHFTLDRLKEVVEEAMHPAAPPEEVERPGVLAYGRAVQKDLDERGQVGTALVYGTALNHLEGTVRHHAGKADVAFEAVDAPLLRAHEKRMLTAPPGGLGHKPNYAAKQLRTIRAVLRRAVQDEEPGADAAVRAFSVIKIKKQRVEKVRLSLEQVRRFEAATFTGRARDVQDWWVFSFYAAGMRWGDLVALRWAQIERDADGEPVFIRFVQRKTTDPLGTPLVVQVRDVLERWRARPGPGGEAPSPFVFGLVTEAELADPHRARSVIGARGALARNYLTRMSTKLDLPKMSPHTARHSFADVLRKSGASLYEISKSLGHRHLSTTEQYLAGFDVGAVGDAMRKAFG